MGEDEITMATAKRLRIRYQAKKITKTILKTLAMAGVVCIAGSSPSFVRSCIRYFQEHGIGTSSKKKDRKKLVDTFTNLRRRGLIRFHERNKQLYISLTPEGRKRAGYYQIDELEIKKQSQWDGKWRVLIFDIAEKSRIKRDALRGKLRELGFYLLQKSVWVYPYPCWDELQLLQDFFGFTGQDYLLLTSSGFGRKEIEKRVHDFFF